MTQFTRFLLLVSTFAAGATGFMGPAGAADREAVAAVMVAPAARTPVQVVSPAMATPPTPAALSSRPALARRAPTLNHQRPLNDDLARFTRAF